MRAALITVQTCDKKKRKGGKRKVSLFNKYLFQLSEQISFFVLLYCRVYWTYGFVNWSWLVFYVNNHFRFLNAIEISSVNRDHSTSGSKAFKWFDFHHSRIMGIVERISFKSSISPVDGECQSFNHSRRIGSRINQQN